MRILKNDNTLILEKIIPVTSSELISSLLLKINYMIHSSDNRMNTSRLLAKIVKR